MSRAKALVIFLIVGLLALLSPVAIALADHGTVCPSGLGGYFQFALHQRQR